MKKIFLFFLIKLFKNKNTNIVFVEKTFKNKTIIGKFKNNIITTHCNIPEKGMASLFDFLPLKYKKEKSFVNIIVFFIGLLGYHTIIEKSNNIIINNHSYKLRDKFLLVQTLEKKLRLYQEGNLYPPFPILIGVTIKEVRFVKNKKIILIVDRMSKWVNAFEISFDEKYNYARATVLKNYYPNIENFKITKVEIDKQKYLSHDNEFIISIILFDEKGGILKFDWLVNINETLLLDIDLKELFNTKFNSFKGTD